MPRVLAVHEVKDVQHWLGSSTRTEFFEPLGVTEIKMYVDPQGSQRVGVSMNVPDMDAVMAAVQGPEGAAAMARDGVLSETMVILVEA